MNNQDKEIAELKSALEKAERERDEAKQAFEVLDGHRARLQAKHTALEAELKEARETLNKLRSLTEIGDGDLVDVVQRLLDTEARATALQERVAALEVVRHPGDPTLLDDLKLAKQDRDRHRDALAASRKQVAELTAKVTELTASEAKLSEALAKEKLMNASYLVAGVSWDGKWINERAERAEARITALEAALEKANNWVINHRMQDHKDHACSQCMGEDTGKDFVCAYHAALAPASAVSSPGLAPTDGGQQ